MQPAPSQKALRAQRIVQAVANAARRWAHPAFPPRIAARRAAAERLGYAESVAEHALEVLFNAIAYESIAATIVDELGSLEALDGFVSRPGRPAAFARGVDRVLIIASNTTIGVAIAPLIFALCAKACVTVKDRDDRLVAAFARTLIEEEPLLAQALRVQAWKDHQDPSLRAEIAEADAVLAFGQDATMHAVRAQCKPDARFIPFGSRTSVAYIPREALADEETAYRHAREAAPDALLYDGDGCLSTHAIFAENGAPATPRAFAALFARACDATAVRFPHAGSEIAAATAAYRDRAAFRAAQGRGSVSGGTLDHPRLVVFDPPRDEPPPFFPRAIGVYPVDEPNDMLAYVRTHAVPLEAIATPPPPRAALLDAFIASGASRIAPLGRLQSPPLAGNHGGQGRITPFVRFIYRDDDV